MAVEHARQALIDALWTDAARAAIFAAVDNAPLAFPGAIRTARKGYTAWARQFQFAALRPLKGGGAAPRPGRCPPRLRWPARAAAATKSWSERLEEPAC